MAQEHVSVSFRDGVSDMENKAGVLLSYAKEQLKSYVYKITHRTSPKHFTRETTSQLTFMKTALVLLRMVKKSIKVELMDFFYQADKEIAIPSRQALSKAREKISYTAFADFFNKSCELVVDDHAAKTHKGYRLFAIDGTTFVVGRHDKLSNYFGDSTAVAGKAMCRISAVVDILGDSIARAIPAPFSLGERALALSQVESLQAVSDALFLFDRGYWSPKLCAGIIEQKQKFLMRLQSSNSKSSVTLSDGIEENLRRYSFVLPSGVEEVLITNIPEDEMTDDELANLYAKRWGIETKYLELKARLQIDKFSGESVNTVLQDIYCTLYISNLVAFIAESSNKLIEAKTAGKDNLYEQKTNKSVCIATLRKRFVDICLTDDPVALDAQLDKLYNDISHSVTYIAKSKPKPRNKRNIKSSRLHYSKPLL